MSDSLVKLSADQSNPADVKSSSFKVKTPAVGSGEEGKNQLVKLSMEQGCAGEVTGTNFKVEKNTGESGTSLGQAVSVDFGTGTHSSPDQKK